MILEFFLMSLAPHIMLYILKGLCSTPFQVSCFKSITLKVRVVLCMFSIQNLGKLSI